MENEGALSRKFISRTLIVYHKPFEKTNKAMLAMPLHSNILTVHYYIL